MFDRFTEPSRAVLRCAQEAARHTGAAMLRPGHLVLGVLEVGDPVAARALEVCGVRRDGLRAAVVDETDYGHATPHAPPFSPQSKRALEGSVRAAVELESHHIAPHHLLLAVLACDDGSVGTALTLVGTSSSHVEETVRTLLGVPSDEVVVANATAKVTRTFGPLFLPPDPSRDEREAFVEALKKQRELPGSDD